MRSLRTNMEQKELFIQAIESFEGKQDSLSEELDQFISYIARTGDILAPWEKVQKVFMKKLQVVIDEFYTMFPYKTGKVNANSFNDDFDEMKSRLIQLTEEFDSAPFTIQRLCELLSEPRKNYTKCDKFMRGLEKNLMVVSSWSNLPRRQAENNEAMVNGVDVGASNGYIPAIDNRLKSHWANLPPSPISTVPPKIPGAPDFSAVSFPKLEPPQVGAEEIKEGETSEAMSSSESVETSQEVDKTDETTVNDSKEETESSDKPNISATIISSSPPKTINIKRKIEDSPPDAAVKEAPETQIAESPTKKIKSDFPEVKEPREEEKKDKEENVVPNAESAISDNNNESAKISDSPQDGVEEPESTKNVDPESSNDSAVTNDDSANSLATSNPELEKVCEKKSDDNVGSSVDPPPEKMEVD